MTNMISLSSPGLTDFSPINLGKLDSKIQHAQFEMDKLNQLQALYSKDWTMQQRMLYGTMMARIESEIEEEIRIASEEEAKKIKPVGLEALVRQWYPTRGARIYRDIRKQKHGQGYFE